MRILILDSSDSERRRLADVIRQTFPEAEMPSVTSEAELNDALLIGAGPGTAGSGWDLDRDVQAAARFPIENPNPVMRFTRNGRVLFANRASQALLASWGVSRACCLPEDQRKVVEHALDSGRQIRRVEPCGEKVFGLDYVPMVDAGYVNMYGRDITIQRAEREVLDTIMENTRAQLAYLDAGFNFVTVNSAYAAGSGRSKQDLIGRNHFEVFPNLENQAIFERVRDTGQAVEFLARPYEFPDQPSRGTTYWDWTLTPVRGGNGRVKGLVLSLLDVTERIRAQQLREALNSIDTSISSTLDFSQIVQRVMAEASAALGCDTATLTLRTRDGWLLSALHGLRDKMVGRIYSDAEAPYAAQAAETRDVCLVEDVQHDPAIPPEWARSFNVRSFMAVPLSVRDQVNGVLFLNYAREITFTEAQVDFARKLATAVSLALENARLVNELEQHVQERTAELQAIFDSLPDAVYVGNDQGIQRCNQAALDILGCSSIEDLHDRIPNLADKIQNRSVDTGERIPPGDEPFVRALQGERATMEMIQRNLRTGQDFVVRSACAPIVRAGQVIGAVAINTDITERKRIEEVLRSHDEELHAYSRRMVEGMENERRAIARELHDEAGQALTSLKVGLGLLQRDTECPASFGERLEELKSTADGVMDNLRRLAMDLRPGALDKAGLVPAIRQYVHSYQQQTALQIDFVTVGLDDDRLPADLETNLYRMTQEALTNAARHAQAHQIGVALQRSNGRVSLVVEDDGVGFDLAAASKKGHLGLVGMRERAEMMGGNLHIETAPGQGTTVFVEVPYGDASAEAATSQPNITSKRQ